jgi:hypothetical protein
MIKKIQLLAISFGIVSMLAAQPNYDQPHLPTVLPPTPEAAAITKVGQLSASPYSGSASASIPLYEIKMKGFSVPIALNYAGNGTKVDEIPGRTGMGFSLSPSGVVNRSVHGLPDEKADRLHPNTDFPASNAATLDFLNKMAGPQSAGVTNYDSEPDEFRFSAPGISGKFIIKDDGTAMQIPYSNLKIQVLGALGKTGYLDKFIITNTNGVKYFFGGNTATEQTVTHTNSGQYLTSVQLVKTGFFLTRILAPNGDEVNLNYTAITINTKPSVNYSITNVNNNGNSINCVAGIGSCDPYFSQFSSSLSTVGYNTFYLSSVSATNGATVSFGYESRPDAGSDNRLKTIYISCNGYAKNYALDYLDIAAAGGTGSYGNFAAMSSYNKRFFLKEIKTTSASYLETGTTDTLKYLFDYEEPEGLPNRFSCAQDHLGYYNGRNNQTLLPPGYITGEGNSSNALANRSPDGSYAKKGMLKRITYPTGGMEELEYEPNTAAVTGLMNTTQLFSVSGPGSGISSPLSYTTNVFSVLRTHDANLYMSTVYPPSCEGNPNCPAAPGPNTRNLIKVDVINTGTSTTVYSKVSRYYQNESYTVNLLANNNYKMVLTVYGMNVSGFADLRVDTAAAPVYVNVNKEIPGVRVKSVLSFDPLSNKSTRKYYKYSGIASSISSGHSIFSPQYMSYSLTQDYCPFSGNNTCLGCSKKCYFKTLSSGSGAPLYLYDGNHIAYETITESDDPAFVNGGSETYFNVYTSGIGLSMMGYDNNNLPNNTYTTFEGTVKANKVYNSANGLVKEQYSYYRLDSASSVLYDSYAVATNYMLAGLFGEVPIRYGEIFEMYNVGRYQYKSAWIQLDSTVTIDYDNNGQTLITKTGYGYGSPANTAPATITTYNSTGNTISINTKYPTDFASTAPNNAMIAANVIGVPVELTTFQDAVQMDKVTTQYTNVTGSIFEPQTVKTKRGTNAEENRIQYYSYDSKGNALELSKESDIRISYIYGYNKQYPVAEIKNASVNEVAYSSFEDADKGNFTYTGAENVTTAMTGNQSWNLAAGSITKTGLTTSKAYTVSYWLKDGTGTVTVNGGSGSYLMSRNGFTLYTHSIASGVSTVTVSGSATIDELRLCPADAKMVSYTYRPNVGATSICAVNNQILYYLYDGEGKLIVIKDIDQNIVKQFEYKYKQTILPCSNITANWQPTGITECVKNNAQNNNNTGEQRREERDMNNCSPAYLQLRWVSLGTNGNCPPVANCSGADKRVINGVCATGVKVVVGGTKINATTWLCTFKYVWSDGYAGPEFTETSNTGCYTGSGGE